jgi:hypothetical protein
MNKHLGRRSGRATPSSPPHLASTPTSIYNEIKVFYSRVGNCTVSYVDSYQVQKANIFVLRRNLWSRAALAPHNVTREGVFFAGTEVPRVR